VVEPPRPAKGGATTELLELLQGVRVALTEREEAPSGDWVEASATDLKSGRQLGWYYPVSEGGGGIGLATLRGRRLWGHVHATPGPEGAERAVRLAEAILTAEDSGAEVATLGFSGLPEAEESAVAARLAQRPGSMVIRRQAFERDLTEQDESRRAEPPAGLRRVAVSEVDMAALAELDWQSFRGSVDDLMIGGSPEEYRRILTGLLRNTLGRFLDEASVLLVDESGTRLVGGVLTSEVTARQALFLDLMVAPQDRRRGIGRFLLGWAFRSLRALGYVRVRLWVTTSNEAAVGLYLSEGFHPVAATTIYRWEPGAATPHPQSDR
jgi:ribosomal protein S18 acetylase RimI-like enzyme